MFRDDEGSNARSAAPADPLLQRVKERGDVARILQRNVHLRDGIGGQGFLRVLNPQGHVFRRIADEAREVAPRAHMQQRKADSAFGISDPRNQMAAAATKLLDQGHAALEIAGKIGWTLLAQISYRAPSKRPKQARASSGNNALEGCVRRFGWPVCKTSAFAGLGAGPGDL